MYWLTGLLGVLLAFAPYVFNYANNTAALWTSVIVGIGVAALSVVEAVARDRENWEYWTLGILGVAAVVAPFALRFNTFATPMWTTVITGGLITLFAATRLLTKSSQT